LRRALRVVAAAANRGLPRAHEGRPETKFICNSEEPDRMSRALIVSAIGTTNFSVAHSLKRARFIARFVRVRRQADKTVRLPDVPTRKSV
jgi:hypothetical protein